MNRALLLQITLAVSFVCIMAGLIFKIMHYQNSSTYILLGLIAAIIFTIIALFEIWSSNRILTAEKFMWTTSFLVIPGVAGILYFFLARKRVLVSL